MKLPLIVLLTLIVACGQGKGKNGKSGSDGDDGVSADQEVATAGAKGAKGAKGDPGADGEDGVDGADGEQGPEGDPNVNPTIGLYDSAGELVGYKFNDGDTADVFLTDGKHALIDMDTGDLKPLDGYTFFCLYTSNDCSGQCYVYDRKWLNTLVLDNSNALRLAARGTANEGAKTMNSYTQDDGACVASTIGTVESYKADAYSTTMQIPFNAPLYWGLQE